MKSKITATQLREIIREELETVRQEQQLEEAGILTDPNFIAGLAALLGVGGTYATSVIKAMKGKSKEEKAKIAADMAKGISKSTGA